jgi:hypothetical protein
MAVLPSKFCDSRLDYAAVEIGRVNNSGPTGARCRLARCFVGQLTLTAVSSMTNEVCFV